MIAVTGVEFLIQVRDYSWFCLHHSTAQAGTAMGCNTETCGLS